MVYTLLVSIGYVYVYPVLYMLSTSFKSREDIINPMVMWVPTSLYLDNYVKAYNVLKYFPTLFKSTLITLLPAVIQTIVCSFIGYGLAKFRFKLKKLWFTLILLTFLIPSQVYMIPKYVMFNSLNLLNNPMAVILPAILGQGVNSAIFILIFYQFFRMIPKSIEEAAEIDGAGPYKRFFLIGIPLAVPAFITSFLFGFVWYWNETYFISLFLGDKAKDLSLQIRLAYFVSEYSSLYSSEETALINEGIRLAATLLIILPMLIVYFILQRWFTEGVERSGITGE
ncbi:MAG: carbohydrate ABC transporter permease [Bacillales bacterium]|nr:carbohydrate ABC transporter permease [Bacillales bacterium]